MSKKSLFENLDLTKEQLDELKKLANDITDTAKSVVEDYEKNPSQDSGSLIEIHEDSPYMEEKFPGKLWENMKKIGNQYVFSPKNKPKVDSKGIIIEESSHRKMFKNELNKLIDNETHSQSLSSLQ